MAKAVAATVEEIAGDYCRRWMGCAGDPCRDNHYLRDYHGIGWLLGRYTYCQLMIMQPLNDYRMKY